MSDNYKSISQLEVGGEVNPNDILIISQAPSNGESGYTSQQVNIQQIATAISNIIDDDIKNHTKKDLGNLAYKNKDDLENNSSFNLKTYIPVLTSDNNIIKCNSGHVISSIEWNKNSEITAVGQFDINQLSTDFLNTNVQQTITDRLTSDITCNSLNDGITLATLSVCDKIYEIKSGNPTNIVNISNRADVGDEIAHIEYCNGNQIYIKNGLNVQTQTEDGNVIAIINNKEIKNGLNVQQNTTTGSKIATINGTDIYDGLNVQSKALNGNIIATINDIPIRDGLVVQRITEKGNIIATINNKYIYSGIEIENDSNNNTTHLIINNEKYRILGGIKVGNITPKVDNGTIIATANTDNGSVDIRAGIDIDELNNKLDNLQRSINDLLIKYNSLNYAIDEKLKQYVKLQSNTTQIIKGAVKFMDPIDGKISYASMAEVAIKAKWSN